MNHDPLSSARRIAYLISGFIRNTLTLEERAELDGWIGANDENMRLFGKLTDSKNIAEAHEWFASHDLQLPLDKFTTAIENKAPVRKLSRIWVAAAGLLLLLVAGSTWLVVRKQPASIVHEQIVNVNTDSIIPGSKKAVVVNHEGKTIDLSLPATKYVAIDDNSQATNDFTVLNYTTGSTTVRTHTLRTPRGGEYQLILPDGTRVWLNAESSITYPTAFVSKERVVELSGEAYFEVSADKQKPFHVMVSTGSDILVVGTHFNVNAYPNTAMEKISLLEGRIDVKRRTEQMGMKPNQQLVVKNGILKLLKNANVNSAIAWTRGKFSFDHTQVTDVMQQVSRWYDVNVDYGGDTSLEFSGELYRNSSLDEVLRMLRSSTGQQITIRGKTISVRP